MKKILLILAFIFIFSIPCYALHLPDIRSGIAMRMRGELGVFLIYSIELYQFNFLDSSMVLKWWFLTLPIKNLSDWPIDVEFANNLVFLSLNYILVPVVEIQLFAYFGYDFADKDYETGLILGAILW